MSQVFNDNNTIREQNNYLTIDHFTEVATADRRVLSRPPKIVGYLDRGPAINDVARLLTERGNIVVIHGPAGHGKRTLATLYLQATEADYDQIGWVNLEDDLRIAVVEAFRSFSTTQSGKKSEKLYRELGDWELNRLQNHDAQRLLVITGVTDWATVTEFIDFLQLNQTDYLITAEQPLTPSAYEGYDLRVANYPVPRIDGDDILSLIQEYVADHFAGEALAAAGDNLFVYNLIKCQARATNARSAYKYVERIFSVGETEEDLVVNVLYEGTLFGPEIWLLLQFAVLPDGWYSKQRIERILFYLDQINSEEDVTGLSSYEAFTFAFKDFLEDKVHDLDGLLKRLSQNGWLTEEAGEYRLHKLLRTGLKAYFHEPDQPNQGLPAELFSDVASSLRGTFFQIDQEWAWLDDILYPQYLKAFIDFIPPQPQRELTDIYWKLISILEARGRFKEELPLRMIHWELVDGKRESDFLLEVLKDLCGAQIRFGDYRGSTFYANELIRRAVKADNPVMRIIGRILLSQALYFHSNYSEAWSIAKGETDQVIKIFGNGITVGTHYHLLGMISLRLGNYNQALDFHEKARLIKKESLGEEHPQYATTLHEIGSVHALLGNYDKALDFFEKARLIEKESLGEDHPNYATTFYQIGSVHTSLGNYDKALDFFEKAHLIYKESLGEEHPNYASTLHEIGSVHTSLGNYDKALDFFEKAHLIYKESLGEEHPNYASTLHEIGSVNHRLGNYDEALDFFEKARLIYKEALGEEHPHYASALCQIGATYGNLGDFNKAHDFLSQASIILNKIANTSNNLSPIDQARLNGETGILYQKQSKLTEAKGLLASAVQQLESKGILPTEYYLKRFKKALAEVS